MNKKSKVILIIAGILLVILAVLAAFNWDKIIIVKDAISNKYTKEDIDAFGKKHDDILNEASKNVFDVNLTPLTEEEKKALEEGKITEEEARKIVLGEKVYVDGKVVDKEKPEQEKPNVPEGYVDISAQIISEIYVLESTYKGKLSAIEHNTLAAYNALPPEQKTTVNKYKLANSAMSQGLALKAECDAKMNDLLARLEKNLIEGGKDTSIVGQIRAAYESEKSAMQSYYLSKYSGR